MSATLAAPEAITLAAQPRADALAVLRDRGQLAAATAIDVAGYSLELAPGDARTATTLWEFAVAVQTAIGDDPAVAPWLSYAQARLALLAGDMPAAEVALTAARTAWAARDERTLLARSGLGLAQVMTMQGRFADAHAVIEATIDALAVRDDLAGEEELLLAAAQQNLATIFSYQERHHEALAVLDAARAAVAERLATDTGATGATDDTASSRARRALLGRIGLDRAVTLSYLDRPDDAVETLRTAIDDLTRADAHYDRGRAYTNLGHVFVRTGRFAEALTAFDAAMLDLLGTHAVEDVPEQWDAADVLFLEQAIAHLSLNLLPEAATDLDRAIALFQRGERRYEWGQALFYRALVALREGAVESAQTHLATASGLFAALDNRYWLNRVRTAQVLTDAQAGALPAASAQLDELLAEIQRPDGDGPVMWDLAARIEVALLGARFAVRQGDLDAARQRVAWADIWLTDAAPEAAERYPQLAWQVLHTQGQVARAAGEMAAARRRFEAALLTVETQRATLPVEEFRTSFLIDKRTIYADLVLALLDEPAPEEETVASAFAIIERARARALLERLLVAVDDRAVTEDQSSAARRAAVRQRLTWLYNQLLSDAPDSRGAARAISEEIRAHEAALQRIEWRLAPWLADAEPVALATLQSALHRDEQAVIYFLADDEWMAFIVAPTEARLIRRLGASAQVDAALADLRFQLGRVEIGGDYAVRHAGRLLKGVRAVLRRLYDLLFAPLRGYLHAARLLIVPFGDLHLAPFHALWDGGQYLLDAFEINYAPSASVELLRRQRAQSRTYTSLAAFALRDASIPQAEAEVYAAADHFTAAQLYVDVAAHRRALHAAAASADVLHFATHGLFRPDNPYFSALKLVDGWIDVREIYRLPLRARLVILSACESGAVQVQGADESIGLVRGFLGAGAQALIVSLWNVHDASAAQIMHDFYQHLIEEGRTPAAALRAAQHGAIGNDRHPYYWAPYAAIG